MMTRTCYRASAGARPPHSSVSRRKIRFSKGLVPLLAVFVSASPALAQQDAASVRSVDDCYTTLKSGSGGHYTRVCISSSGNITAYESPAGVEHIRVLDPLEGYRVCRGDGWAPMYDSGSQEYGFDESSSGISIYQPNGRNTLPLRITRSGFNRLQVSQEFFFTKLAYGPADLRIVVKVTNRGTQTIDNVWIQRFFDADVNGDIQDDRAYATGSTVAITDPNGTARGLSLSAGILDKSHWTDASFYQTILRHAESGESTECVPHADYPRTEQGPADLMGLVNYSVGSVGPGLTRTVAFIYRRSDRTDISKCVQM
jgi:hypothetical protein